MSAEDELEEGTAADAAEVNEPGLEALMAEETEALLDSDGQAPDPFADGNLPLAFSQEAPSSAPESEGPVVIPEELDGAASDESAAEDEPEPDADEAQDVEAEDDLRAPDDELMDRAQAAAEAAAGTADELERRVLEAAQMLAAAEAGEHTARKKKPRTPRQDLMLVGLLFANLCLMGVMMAIPGKEEQPQQPASTAHTDPGHVPGEGGAKEGTRPAEVIPQKPQDPRQVARPFELPLGEKTSILPDQEVFDAGGVKMVNGDFEGAASIWHSYIKGHPELQPFQLHVVYLHLGNAYAHMGKQLEASKYLALAQSQHELISLPDDLWAAARQAEADLRGHDMRRYYARFLLQQDLLGRKWTRQGRIVEAFMKIADSYRMDAERGELRAAENRDLEGSKTPAVDLGFAPKQRAPGEPEPVPLPPVKSRTQSTSEEIKKAEAEKNKGGGH